MTDTTIEQLKIKVLELELSLMKEQEKVRELTGKLEGKEDKTICIGNKKSGGKCTQKKMEGENFCVFHITRENAIKFDGFCESNKKDGSRHCNAMIVPGTKFCRFHQS